MSRKTPSVVLVGRPNVGKSTLFNRMTGSRRAIVNPMAGTTRDALARPVVWRGTAFQLFDTGGLYGESQDPLHELVVQQGQRAIVGADLLVLLVDGREGLIPGDERIARELRETGIPVLLAINKTDDKRSLKSAMEFFQLGFDPVTEISAEHGTGVAELMDEMVGRLTGRASSAPASPDAGRESLRAGAELAPPPETDRETRVAIVGRPNVGKSSLVNTMIGAERVLVHDAPGTTRDAVDTAFEHDGRPYVLVDTAGIRRKGKVSEALEKLAVVMALRSLERCQVALLVMDSSEGLTAQDAHIGGYAHEAGRAVILVVNKWDLVPHGMVRKAEVVEQLRERLPFLDYAPICFTSATTGEGVRELFQTIDQVAVAARRKLSTDQVTTTVRQAIERRPTSVRGEPLTLQSAVQVAVAPPTFALKVNRPEEIHFSYERYLVRSLRLAFGFTGSPIRLSLRRASTSRPRRGVRR